MAAVQALEDALRLAVRTGNRHGEGFCAAGLAQLLHDRCQLDQARRHYERGLHVGLPPSNSLCAVRLGILLLEQGRAAEADEYLVRGMAMCATLLEKTPRLYEALYQRALAELASRQPAAALCTYKQAVSVCAAKGVVQCAIRDIWLLQRASPSAVGLDEAVVLLNEGRG